MSKYPAQIDNTITLPTAVDNNTPVSGDTVNRLKNTIIAVESELGIKPSGVYSTVRARLDALENIISNFQIIELSGDLGGTLNSPRVIGLQGLPVSTETPTVNQVLKFNGIAWVPATVSSTATFSLGGDLGGTEFDQIVIGLQTRAVANITPSDGYVLTWKNSSNQWEPLPAAVGFSAGGDLSGTATNQIVTRIQTRDVSNTIPTDGYILTWNNSSNQWRPLPFPASILNFELPFVTTLSNATGATFTRIGARKIDISKYPSTIGIFNRTVTFVVDIQKTAGASSVEVQLYDVTNNAQVVSLVYSTDTSLVESTSNSLTVGSSLGNIRSDSPAMYEVSIRMNGGVAGTDAVYCNNARLLVSYA